MAGGEPRQASQSRQPPYLQIFNLSVPAASRDLQSACSIESEESAELWTDPALRLYHLLPTMIAFSPPSKLNLIKYLNY